MSDEKPPNRRATTKYHMPRSRLLALVNRPGGVRREEAIAEATRRVETMRDPYMEIVDELIGQLEATAALLDGDPDKGLVIMQDLANRLITIAGTFGLSFLVEASMRLCDLTQMFTTRSPLDLSAITVHVRAIRLFGPLNPPVPEAAAKHVLLELQRVVQHCRVTLSDHGAAEPECAQSTQVESHPIH